MHWRWKNWHAAWHGQFKGHKKDSIIILEGVANQETWIWHAFFGMSGSCNDSNVLQRSPLFARLANGEILALQFVANGRTYDKGYYLANGIYLKWATFVKPLISPSRKKEQDFHYAQAAARKDIERAFRILQVQFAIVRGPAKFWDQEILWYIMMACVIMHNMIIENKHGQDVDGYHYKLMGHPVRVRRQRDRIARFIECYHAIRDENTHENLQKDLMGEWWTWWGQQRSGGCR